MRKKKKVLSREEMMASFYRKKTDHDWLFILEGTEDDIWRFISMTILDPGILFFVICYLTGRLANIFLVYVVVDGLIIGWWAWKAVKKKKRMEERKNEDRTEILLKKVEELKEIERMQREMEEERRKRKELRRQKWQQLWQQLWR